MLDIRLIRENPEIVREAMEKRGGAGSLEEILQVDERHRRLLGQTEGLRARHNETSKQLGRTGEKPVELIAEMRQLGEQISSLQQQTRDARGELDALLLEMPNIPHSTVPPG
ncbi:MAG: serine--tRNA ligase, partial [Dehalococcoidia bacterium]|nr:serine--tRNA ligase [Dehalococcoidia bacterium]